MRERIRNGAAITIAGICLVLGIYSWLTQQPPFTGVLLRFDGPTLVVDKVDPGAGLTGTIQSGTVVTEVDGFLVKDMTPDVRERSLHGDFSEIGILDPNGATKTLDLPDLPIPPIGFALLVGVALLVGIGLWVGRGLAGDGLRPLAISLAVASATPLILVPTWAPANAPLLIAAFALPMAARLVFADGFIAAITRPAWQLIAAALASMATVAHVVIVVAIYGLARWEIPSADLVSAIVIVLAGSITLVPLAVLLYTTPHAFANRAGMARRQSDDRVPLVLAALTPTIVSMGYVALGLGVSVPLLWLLVVVVVLQSNSRVDTLRIQRDTVVAATEIERARLAADLHDDALQEMTVLVRRLDEVGDADAAALARSIADRLREVCGDLRLPILDELGAGPALEWLVARVGETSGREVMLERVDAARPPADVELAVFRVAQEALANAVTHGAPPITVRYDAAATRASLSITDHGGGLSADAAAAAGRSGHYGLLNMRQRAEQIGARIDFRRPADGGTVIGLDWAVG